MKGLDLARRGERLSILCLGAHSDDIEIGAGGTILSWIAAGLHLDVVWCVLSAGGERGTEARRSAEDFLVGTQSRLVECSEFKDTQFPSEWTSLKQYFRSLKERFTPDVVLTHRRDDAHQDHRTVCELTWNAFRDHTILEYEIPKWDGDLGQPNMFVALGSDVMARKVDLLMTHFGTQRSKDWFDADVFRGLARLRGMECRAPERFAEAFVMRKALLT